MPMNYFAKYNYKSNCREASNAAMKKINSIGYGGKILAIGMVFLLLIPMITYIISPICRHVVYKYIGKISLLIGLLTLLFLALLLTIELRQDRKLNLYYDSQKNKKLKLGNDIFECQSCGNRKIQASDTSCPICGIHFTNKGE